MAASYDRYTTDDGRLHLSNVIHLARCEVRTARRFGYGPSDRLGRVRAAMQTVRKEVSAERATLARASRVIADPAEYADSFEQWGHERARARS